MKRPSIYGDQTKCRAAVARYIKGAEHLLSQATGVRKRINADFGSRPTGIDRLVAQTLIDSDWGEQVRRWYTHTRVGLTRYLQDQLKTTVPILADGLPRDDGKPHQSIDLENGQLWLSKALKELKELQAALGVKRDLVKVSPAPAQFEELHASGLVAQQVIDDHAKEMRSPRTPRQLYNAIGAAKELTEATLRAALEQLDLPFDRRDDLPTLMKKWRRAIGKLAPPDPKAEQKLDAVQAALARLVTFLAEWRNAYGRGHGHPQYPPGLTVRHARLATDAAETCVRFIIMTMDDLQLLPPD